MENKKSLRVSRNFYDFVEKVGANRVKIGVDLRTKNLCEIPDLIVDYFKQNNERYLEFLNSEVEDGD